MKWQWQKYRWYFCEVETESLDLLVDHCTSNHCIENLKYHELQLDEQTGKLKYQTKIHTGVIPSVFKRERKSIVCKKI